MKKMKKRRELDALVNGKLGRRKKGQHELLRNESDSSEVEEFSIPEKTVLRKSSSCRFCATCMTVCGFFLLAACLAAIAGLVWVHLEMKKEVDQLRSQLGQVQLTPLKGLEQVSKKQQRLEKMFKDVQEKDLVNIQENISKLMIQMSTVNSSVIKLQKTQTEDIMPPIDNKELLQNIATFGSKLATLEQDVSNLKTIQTTVDNDHDKIMMVDALAGDIDNVNFTMASHFHQHLIEIHRLKNKTESSELRLALMEMHPGTSPVPNIEALVKTAIKNSLQDIQNLTLEQGLENSEAVQQLEDIVANLQGQVNSVNETLMFIKNDIQQGKMDSSNEPQSSPDPDLMAAQLGDYTQFKSKTIAQLQILNVSVGSLSERVDQLEHTQQEEHLPITSSDLHTAPDTTDRDNKITGDNDKSMETKQDLLPTGGDVSTTTQSTNDGFLHLKEVSQKEDLAGWVMYDGNQDGKISYEEMTAAFPDALISRERFLNFDTDGDESLNNPELDSSFGFSDSDSGAENGSDGSSKKRRVKKKALYNV